MDGGGAGLKKCRFFNFLATKSHGEQVGCLFLDHWAYNFFTFNWHLKQMVFLNSPQLNVMACSVIVGELLLISVSSDPNS